MAPKGKGKAKQAEAEAEETTTEPGPLHVQHAAFIERVHGVTVDPDHIRLVYSTRNTFRGSEAKGVKPSPEYKQFKKDAAAAKKEAEAAKAAAKKEREAKAAAKAKEEAAKEKASTAKKSTSKKSAAKKSTAKGKGKRGKKAAETPAEGSTAPF